MGDANQFCLLISAHDQLGHKGFYVMHHTLADQFWWPDSTSDIHWLIDTCHLCQIHSLEHVIMPPVIQILAPLFWKAYINMMHIPPLQGHTYIAQACCSLTGWVEWYALS
ncbi:hypothetical protein P691DRAFT_689323 [Macrolepiota fuliginosa MF-IS2]|uniref:Integrase zinc-binding domain-containing protein n=1 Tax=Macrolepiota fuliginosa MF-IS2 TaxID=1400762 RepID=A0A9P6BVL7_9AGAR|nr:hypothetical protein P691DRAFT_689323 [Macrolepiota fuliginosa MF-IS2]